MAQFSQEQLQRLQVKRASLVKKIDFTKNPKTLLAVSAFQKNQNLRAGGVLYDLETNTQLKILLGNYSRVTSPYISGYLSLRNKKPLLNIISNFPKFDLLMVEGAGRQHPRHYGLACDLGVDLNIPTVGITQTSLYGEIDFSQTLDKGGSRFHLYPVYDGQDLIAYFIKKSKRKKGLFLSIGHKISLETAVDIILPLLKHKLPEPLFIIKMVLKKFD
ncbi:MAG: endonuclease V [Promethearchaeota archaeon]